MVICKSLIGGKHVALSYYFFFEILFAFWQCYALDTLTSQKEPVGYVILDLRTAQQKPAVS